VASKDGWNRTYDGSLAEIKGAKINEDAVNGVIEILGEHRIDVKSGGTLYLAANDSVDILSNNEVNIGGKYINIGSAQIIEKRQAVDSNGNLKYDDNNNPIYEELDGATGELIKNDITKIEGGIRLVSSVILKKKITEATVTDIGIENAQGFSSPELSEHIKEDGTEDYTPTGATSKVYILPSGIEMASKNGI